MQVIAESFMSIRAFIFIPVLMLGGCGVLPSPFIMHESYEYNEMSDAEYGDGVAPNTAISITFKDDDSDISSYKGELTEALLELGFKRVAYERSDQGYAINIDINQELGNQISATFLVNVLSLGLMPFPPLTDVSYLFYVSFYKDGRFMRSSTYRSHHTDHTKTIFFLLYPFVAPLTDSVDEANTEMVKDLAKNIALDFPSETLPLDSPSEALQPGADQVK